MKPIVIKKLFQSVSDLESAIGKAKESFSVRGDSGKEVVDRIRHYEDILAKQKKLITSLCEHAMNNEWQEVSRHVKLINAYSLLIRDDARELLSPVPLRSVTTEVEVEYLS